MRSKVIVAIITLLMVGTSASVSPAVIAATSTTTELTPAIWPVFPGQPIPLNARVRPGSASGTVELQLLWDGRWNTMDTGQLTANPAAVLTSVQLEDPGRSGGTYTFRARYLGDGSHAPSTSEPIEVVVSVPTHVTMTTNKMTVMEGRPVRVDATVDGYPGREPTGGDVRLERKDSSGAVHTLRTDPLPASRSMTWEVPLPAGRQTLRVRYLGSGHFEPSVSKGSEVLVEADDALLVSGVAINTTRVYPTKDGYRDRVSITGRSQERITLTTIVKRKSTGAVVHKRSTAVDPGKFQAVWTGRKANGSLYAAGTYAVKVRAQDQAGNSRQWYWTVKLSHKKIVWRSWSASRFADQTSGRAHSKYAWVREDVSGFGRGLELFGNLFDEWAYAAYDFVVPKAAAYRAVKFKAYGRVARSGAGPATLELKDWSTGRRAGSRDTGRSLGWYSSKTVSGKRLVTTKTIGGLKRSVMRGFVEVVGIDAGHWDVGKVKLSLQYGRLE